MSSPKMRLSALWWKVAKVSHALQQERNDLLDQLYQNGANYVGSVRAIDEEDGVEIGYLFTYERLRGVGRDATYHPRRA